MAPGLSGCMAMLPAQRSIMRKCAAPADWAATVAHLDAAFPRAFAQGRAGTWAGFEIVYSYTRYSGPDKPAAAGYGWKARLTRPGADGFLWIRGSKTEIGVARVVGDGPDETTARALVDLGRELLESREPGRLIGALDL